MEASSVADYIRFAFINRLSWAHWLVISSGFFLSESQRPMTESHTVLDQHLSPSITEMHTSDHDLENSGTNNSEKASISIPGLETETLDIEHVPVQNDPRKWSSFRKVSFLTQAPS